MALTSAEEVLQKLRCQTIRIPKIRSAFAEWPFATSPYLEQTRQDVDLWLDRYVLVSVLTKAPPAHYSAVIFPIIPN